MASKNKHLILWLVGFLIVICSVTTVSIILLMDSGPIAIQSDSRWLHLRLNSRMTEAPGNEGLVMDPADLPPLSSEVVAGLHNAAQDEHIHAVLVEIDGLNVGWAQAESLRSALRKVVAAEKPCTVWSEAYDMKSFYVASACDTLAIAPEGLPLVNGMNVSQSYFAGTLEMLGVRANFEHVGDFKSAVEPYERTEPSEAAAEATNALLDSLYNHITEEIAVDRGLEHAEIIALIDDPPITARSAVERGLLDERIYRDDLIERLNEAGDRLKGAQYLSDDLSSWGGKGVVAVVHAEGPIVSGKGGPDVFGDSVVGSRTVVKILGDLEEDSSVDAVVLRVNSPGGSGMASDDIWHAVEALKKTKPVVASMGDYAASGGYYIAMGTDRIFAEPTTITGSIGVFGGKMNLAGLLEKAGMSQYEFSRGARSDLLSNVEDFDPEDRQLFRAFLASFYETFVTKAAEGRGMTFEDLHEVAQGRVWTGKQALERNLVDELGGLSQAVDSAAELAGLSTYQIDRLPKRLGFMDQLFEEMMNPEVDTISLGFPGLPMQAQSSLKTLFLLDQILADGSPAAMLPGQLVIE